MKLSRRDLAAAGAFALGAASLLHSAPAQAEAADDAALKQAVEAFRKASLAQDKAKLDQLFADQLSYGHSDGRVESKAEGINGVMNRNQSSPIISSYQALNLILYRTSNGVEVICKQLLGFLPYRQICEASLATKERVKLLRNRRQQI